MCLRFAGFISIVSFTSLAGCDGCVVDKLQKMFAKPSNDCEFLGMLSESIKLVGKGSLELFASDIGELSLGNQGFCFSSNKFLLKNNDAGAVGLLVFELCDLVGDLLLA